MKQQKGIHMSIKHKTETPNIPYGPATGVQSPEPHNEALSTGADHEYRGDSTPGTADYAEPRHVQGGPGHKDCSHEYHEKEKHPNPRHRIFGCFSNYTFSFAIL